jgi:DNA-binding transcriptional LysR family regulator
MNINFELFKTFYVVANFGSISKGAEELNISQPAVTQSIKTLEDQIGGTLFIRTKKGVFLTNEGAELYNYVKEGMNYFINGTNKFNSLKNLDSGVIRIGASTVISETFLMPYLKQFHFKYPKVEIKLNNNLTETLIKDLRNGSLDIVIMAIPDKDIRDLNIKVIMDIHDIFICDKKDEKIYKIEDLLKQNVILQQSPSVTRVNFDKFLKDNNLICNPFMETVSHNLLKELVINKFGIGVATKEYLVDEIKNGLLYEIKTNISINKRQLGYATMKNSIPNFSTLKLIEIFKNNL